MFNPLFAGRKRHPKRSPRDQKKEKASSIKSVTWGNLTWTDIVAPNEHSKRYLAKTFNFHPLALDDCVSRKQLSKIDIYPGYIFFIFHFPVYDKATRVSTKKQWAVFLGENYLVTTRPGELKTVDKLFRECELNEATCKEYLSHGSGYLIYKLLDRAIDSYFPVLDKILSLMEDVEDAVFDEEVEAAREISVLRRDIITQRSVMFPTRDIFIEMQNKLKRFSKIDLTPYINDLNDHMNKICSTLDECKEIIEVYSDADFRLGTDRVNRILRVLNILATITLPFIIISSIYGMNVFMPGSIEQGEHHAFYIILAASVVITGAMLYFFRRKRWI